MKRTYFTIIALIAIAAGAQVQAMNPIELTQDQKDRQTVIQHLSQYNRTTDADAITYIVKFLQDSRQSGTSEFCKAENITLDEYENRVIYQAYFCYRQRENHKYIQEYMEQQQKLYEDMPPLENEELPKNEQKGCVIL